MVQSDRPHVTELAYFEQMRSLRRSPTDDNNNNMSLQVKSCKINILTSIAKERYISAVFLLQDSL